jgi:spermidine/putrescine transport system permease protein
LTLMSVVRNVRATADMPADGTGRRLARRGTRRGAQPLDDGDAGAGDPDVRSPRGACSSCWSIPSSRPHSYGGVVWQFSTEAWFRVVFERDIFDGTVSVADAHLSIFWRSGEDLDRQRPMLALRLRLAHRLLHRHPAAERSRAIWLFLVTIPFWTNLLIRTFAIQEVIRNEGIVNSLLIWRRADRDSPIQMLYTDFAIMLGMLYVFLPLMVLPLYASMEKLDFRIIEAGYDLYASRFQVLRRIILPLVRPGIIAGSILVFIPSLGSYVTPRVLGGGRNMMIANLIELQFGQGRNWPLGAALSLTLLMIVLIALLFYIRAVSRPEPHHG